MQAQENGAVLDEEQSLFLAGEQIINFDEDVDNSPENDLALNMDHIFEADECDAFDSDVDEDIGYMETHRKKFTLGKLDCGYQWRPTGKKFALGEMCPLTKLSVKCSTLSANQQAVQKYDGEVQAHEFCGKFHRKSYYVEGLGHNLSLYLLEQFVNEIDDENDESSPICLCPKLSKYIFVIQTIAQDAPVTSASSSTSALHLQSDIKKLQKNHLRRTPQFTPMFYIFNNLVTGDPDVNDGTNVVFLRTTSLSKSQRHFINQAKYASKLKKYGIDLLTLSITKWWIRLKLDEDLMGITVGPNTILEESYADAAHAGCQDQEKYVGSARFLEIDWLTGH
ncbi:hypothetical protein Tco_0260665 [Tanacetum coccineum]